MWGGESSDVESHRDTESSDPWNVLQYLYFITVTDNNCCYCVLLSAFINNSQAVREFKLHKQHSADLNESEVKLRQETEWHLDLCDRPNQSDQYITGPVWGSVTSEMLWRENIFISVIGRKTYSSWEERQTEGSTRRGNREERGRRRRGEVRRGRRGGGEVKASVVFCCLENPFRGRPLPTDN